MRLIVRKWEAHTTLLVPHHLADSAYQRKARPSVFNPLSCHPVHFGSRTQAFEDRPCRGTGKPLCDVNHHAGRGATARRPTSPGTRQRGLVRRRSRAVVRAHGRRRRMLHGMVAAVEGNPPHRQPKAMLVEAAEKHAQGVAVRKACETTHAGVLEVDAPKGAEFLSSPVACC